MSVDKSTGRISGMLWGVGVGPGDPDLMTIKAARVLADTRHIAYFAKRGRPGNARKIADNHLRKDCEELRLEYPFTTEIPVSDPCYHDQMTRFYDDGAERIATLLDAGETVAVLCEGDPFFYGSYMYLHDRLAGRFEARVVAGITGMSGCWTAADAPITHGDDVLTVLPGTLDADELTSRLKGVDAAVIMKVGRNMAKIRDAITQAGLMDRALYVARGTMAGETVERLAEFDGRRPAPYFSIVLVPGRRDVR